MNPHGSLALAQARLDDLRRDAERARLAAPVTRRKRRAEVAGDNTLVTRVGSCWHSTREP